MTPRLKPLGRSIRSAFGERHLVTAGLLDSGFASLATFCVGLFAVRTMEPTILGGYALCYQAIFVAGIVPANLLFAPAEIAVVAHPPDVRLSFVGRSIGLGLPPAAGAALAVTAWVLVAPGEIPDPAIRALTVTAVAVALVSPIQDHVRRLLHSGEASRFAVYVSVVQLGTVLVAIALLPSLGLGNPWVPFGALAMANLASLAYGLVAVRWLATRSPADGSLESAVLLQTGRWLLGGAVLGPATGFVCAAIVARLAGAPALGYAEAARVIAQPVWVLAVGLSSVMGPRSMEAGRSRNLGQARHVSHISVGFILSVGIGSVIWLGHDWPMNPLAWLLPTAYVVPGLVAAMIAAQTVHGTVFPFRSELMGAGREASLTKIEFVASGIRAMMASLAGVLYAYAIPLGFLGAGLTRLIGSRRVLGEIYESSSGRLERRMNVPG